MKLHELRKIIQGSTIGDWNILPGSETYLRTWEVSRTPGEFGTELDYVSHHTLMSYEPDISITIAFGMEENVNSMERTLPWNKWPDHSPLHLHFADVFWHGSLVDRQLYVPVDGARAYLPWPDNDDRVTQFQVHFTRLLDQATGRTSQFDRYLSEAGFTVLS